MNMFSFILTLLAPVASAAGIEQLGKGAPGIDAMWGTIRSTFPFTDIGSDGIVFFCAKVATVILGTLSAVAVCVIIYGAIKMITSGSEEGFTEAKKLVIYTSAGLVLAMLADGIILYAITLVQQAAG